MVGPNSHSGEVVHWFLGTSLESLYYTLKLSIWEDLPADLILLFAQFRISASVISFPWDWHRKFFSSWRMLNLINCHKYAGIENPIKRGCVLDDAIARSTSKSVDWYMESIFLLRKNYMINIKRYMYAQQTCINWMLHTKNKLLISLNNVIPS